MLYPVTKLLMKSLIHATILLSCFSASLVYSQSSDSLSLKQRYENETIYLQGKGYVKGDQFSRLKFITIEKEFTFSKEAYPEFLLSAQDHKSANRSFYLALGLYVGSILLLVDKKEGALIPLAGSLVAYGYGLHYQIRSGNRFQHALWVRNRDVLLGESSGTLVLRNRYENETIYLGKGRYMKGSQVLSTRHHALQKEFAFSDEGLKEYMLARHDYRKARPYSFLALGLVVTSFILAKNHETTASWIALGGAAITLPISNHYLWKSQNRLRKAIWLRNRDVLLNAP